MKLHNILWSALCLAIFFSTAVSPVRADEKDEKNAAEQKAKAEAGAAAKAEKEEELKAKIPYSFSDVADNLVIIECTTSMGKMVGSGFIAEMDGNIYIFTNQHVIMGADSIEFKTVTGKKLQPLSVELSRERDLTRLPLAEWEEPLTIAKEIKDEGEEPVAVFGNSDGSGVATKLYGELLSIGPELVEVSADFISGNSGSAILNKEKQVIGIASFVKYPDADKMKEDTKFEGSVRRFGFRLDGVEWVTVNWRQYNEKYGKPYLAAVGMSEAVFEIITGWGNDPFAHAPTENLPDSNMNSWARKHNQMADRVQKIINTQKVSGTQLAKIRDEIKQSAQELAAIIHRLSVEMGKQANDPALTGFLRTEFEEYTKALEDNSAVVKAEGEALSKYIDSLKSVL